MSIYFAAIGNGLGDGIMCKPACEWLVKNSSEPVYFVARGPRQVGFSKYIEGVAGEVNEPDLDARLTANDRFINLRDHSWNRDHDWFSLEFKSHFPNFHVCQMLDAICKDFGIQSNNSEIMPFASTFDNRAAGKVVLVPGTTMISKALRPNFWAQLYRRLLKMNIESFVIGVPERSSEVKELIEMGVPHIPTTDLQQAINLISSARAVVSVDTALMHVGVQQGVKTVAIFGACELYCRPAAHCFPIFTDKRQLIKLESFTYSERQFSPVYTNWDYFPEAASDGDYIDFDDYQRILGLVCQP